MATILAEDLPQMVRQLLKRRNDYPRETIGKAGGANGLLDKSSESKAFGALDELFAPNCPIVGANEPRKTSLWLELTPHCNLKCAFCYNPWREKPPDTYGSVLTARQFAEIVDRLSQFTVVDYIALSGGEPLLFPGLDELVKELRAHAHRLVLTTNGAALSRKRFMTLLDAGIQAVQIPLNAGTPEVHDKLAGRKSWDGAITALGLGVEAGLQTTIVFVATKQNLGELPAVIEIARGLGVTRVMINELQPVGSARLNLASLEVNANAFGRAENESHEEPRENVRLHVVRRGGERDPHRGGWGRWAITPAGELKLCNQASRALGKIQDMDDAELADLTRKLISSADAAFSDDVDNCECFETWTTQRAQEHEPTRAVTAANAASHSEAQRQHSL